jgi:hypothetical protein
MALSILLFFAMLVVVLFAAIIFVLEQGEFEVNEFYPEGAYLRNNIFESGKSESPFKSILTCCYWAIVTATTVGYVIYYCTLSLALLATLNGLVVFVKLWRFVSYFSPWTRYSSCIDVHWHHHNCPSSWRYWLIFFPGI